MRIINEDSFNSKLWIAWVLLLFAFANTHTTIAQNESGSSSDANPSAKQGDSIEVIGKALSVDPIKGDVVIRLEYIPHGNLINEDGTLKRTLKLDTNSSDSKAEIVFEKGKRLTSTEVVLNMYDGFVTDYPFDKHEVELVFLFTVKPEKAAPAAEPTDNDPAIETRPAENETELEFIEVPLTFNFEPSMPGYEIITEKHKESDETYIYYTMKISRSPMVVFFSIFVMILMWAVSLGVVGLVINTVIRGGKIEIAMFSFIATLLFAFVAVRNSQPAVPPIGTFTDYCSFFWAEVILALCLLAILFTWLKRPVSK